MHVSRLVSVALATAGLCGVLGVATAGGASADQEYFWKWSDGSLSQARTFTQAQYGTQSRLPHLIAWSEPAKPSHTVYLQFHQDGKWITESKAVTDSRGMATIDIDPMCSNDTWCDRTFTYRLKIGDQRARLSITYSEE